MIIIGISYMCTCSLLCQSTDQSCKQTHYVALLVCEATTTKLVQVKHSRIAVHQRLPSNYFAWSRSSKWVPFSNGKSAHPISSFMHGKNQIIHVCIYPKPYLHDCIYCYRVPVSRRILSTQKIKSCPPTSAMLCASYISATSHRDCTPTSFFRVMNLLSKGFRV